MFMKYILFLFFISMAFVFDASATADIVNRECMPKMKACMSDVARKFGNNMGPNRDAAQSQCRRGFEECRAANGGITQSTGRVAQMYHPANPDFIECRKTIHDTNSDAFSDCMVARTRPKHNTVKATPAPTPAPASSTYTFGGARCSPERPDKCTDIMSCIRSHGVWSGTACSIAPCPSGTTPEFGSQTKCKCEGDGNFFETVDRGNYAHKCPSQCPASEHKKYNMAEKSCICEAGFEMQNGNCVAQNANTVQPAVAECIRELQEKANACNSAASTAVQKCDPNAQPGDEGDTISALQGLLGGVNGSIQAKNQGSGAMDNCMNAAIASSSGYYALESLREKCDTEIGSCKSSCTDASSFIAANKDRVYRECRSKDWWKYGCAMDSPYVSGTEDMFNADWDRVNKAAFERQIQEMQTTVTENNTKCDTGTAVANRDKMTGFMADMNTSVKSANQCQCQLGSSGANCANQVGPAECASNPTLPGCAQATVNCLSGTDNSVKCACFRNPNSNECKNAQQAAGNMPGKVNAIDASSFAGISTGGAVGSSGSGGDAAGKTDTAISAGDLSGLGADGEAIGADASGTTTADAGSPFGAAAGGSSSGGGAGGGGGADANVASAEGEEDSTGKKLGGLFDVAKSAFGNLFKKGKDEKGTYDPVTGKYIDGTNATGLDGKKWRPRGMVRGLASDSEIAGKFEDIWKVMNRQYKIQDQKDKFLFGEKK